MKSIKTQSWFLASVVIVMVMGIGINSGCQQRMNANSNFSERSISGVPDIADLFPKTVEEIKDQTDHAIDDARKRLKAIIAIPASDRTFENTARALDHLEALSDVAILGSLLEVVEMISPQADLRDISHDMKLKISTFWTDEVSNNRELYQAFKDYLAKRDTQKLQKHLNSQDIQDLENLDAEQQYFLEESMKGFKRAGLDLSDEKLVQLSIVRKKLAEISSKFDRNINDDQSSISVNKEVLKGLPEDFITALKRSPDGQYTLGVDYPTYFTVMQECAVADTRKQLFVAFQNRAYPANRDLLIELIAARNELAHLLGYNSFAEYDLEEQMVKGVARANTFLDDLIIRARKKEKQEFDLFTQDLPESVILSDQGRLQPWDSLYLMTQYKKKHYDIDEQEIAEYFPMDRTIDGLLDVYRRFFNLDFEQLPAQGLWSDDLRVLRVIDAENSQIIGYIVLDLFPRPNKYSHACHCSILHSVLHSDKRAVGVSVLICNFPRKTETKPSLLKRDDVTTFFHEFGHALHSIFGATKMASFSGTSVKRDFVELPSQILEEWILDPKILKLVSGHYKTGEPLSDATIEKIVAVKRLAAGMGVLRQGFLSKLSLACFKEKALKDPDAIYKQLYTQIRTLSELHPDDHMYAAFGHLTGYGAKYYGYMWSKVFALDIFEQIKKQGLLNPKIGRKYAQEILMPGGSIDPNILLRNFLGREPSQDAYLRDLGLQD